MKKSKKTINRIKKKTYKKSEYKKKTYKKGEYKKRVKRILRGGETKKNNKKPPIQITQNNIEKKKRDSFTSNWFVHSDIFSSPILIENRIARDIYQDLSEAEKKIVEKKSKVEKIQLSKSNTKNSLSSAISEGYSKGRTQSNRFKGSMQSMGDYAGSAIGQKVGRTFSNISKQGLDAFSSKGMTQQQQQQSRHRQQQQATQERMRKQGASSKSHQKRLSNPDAPPAPGTSGLRGVDGGTTNESLKDLPPSLPPFANTNGSFNVTGEGNVEEVPKEDPLCPCCNEGPHVGKKSIFEALKGMIDTNDERFIKDLSTELAIKKTAKKDAAKQPKKKEITVAKNLYKTLFKDSSVPNITQLLIAKLEVLKGDEYKDILKVEDLNTQLLSEDTLIKDFTTYLNEQIAIKTAANEAAKDARAGVVSKAAEEKAAAAKAAAAEKEAIKLYKDIFGEDQSPSLQKNINLLTAKLEVLEVIKGGEYKDILKDNKLNTQLLDDETSIEDFTEFIEEQKAIKDALKEVANKARNKVVDKRNKEKAAAAAAAAAAAKAAAKADAKKTCEDAGKEFSNEDWEELKQKTRLNNNS